MKKNGAFFAFFIVIISFVLMTPKLEAISLYQKCDPKLESGINPQLNECLNSRCSRENFIHTVCQLIGSASGFIEIFPSFPETIIVSSEDCSYNYYLRTILSSRAHPPTI